jgi:1,4-alpha-glucan branching enzyme
MMYEHSERFVNPFSHDEVVHGKRALLEKIPGDEWQKLATLRLLIAYQVTRPGKSLLFMGMELGAHTEWNHDASLDWHLADDPRRAGLARFLGDLGRVYRESPALWRSDPDPEGCAWIDCDDRQNSVIAYERRDGGDHVVVVLNCTPVPRDDYRIGVPRAGGYLERLSSDAAAYGGSAYPTLARLETAPVPFHGHAQSVQVRLPPLGTLVLAPERAC